MYFSSSEVFRKLGKNRYAFNPGPYFRTKVFIVNHREKNDIQYLLNKFSTESVIITGLSPHTIKKYWIALPILGAFVLFRYISYKRKLKLILGTRKKEKIPRMEHLEHANRTKNLFTKKDLYLCVIVEIMFYGISIHFFYKYLETRHLNTLLISVLIFIISTFSLYISLLYFYLKKKEENTQQARGNYS